MHLPGTARWSPTTETDIADAIDHHLLEETHYLDVKREIAIGKGANKETARDLAQFALDGGILLIGVEEDTTTRKFDRYPVPLEGLPERIETTASDLCDPPLFVRVRAIPSRDDAAQGYVIVEVPPSPDAPHMVDGCYYSRGDKKRNRLSDPDVERLILARRRQKDAFAGDLEAFVRSDPWSPAFSNPLTARQQEHGHLFLLARPVRSQPQLALTFTHGDGWTDRFRALVQTAHRDQAARAALADCDSYYSHFTPDLDRLERAVRRPGGAALTVHELMAWPALPKDATERRLFDLQLDEDGCLKLFCARATDSIPRSFGEIAYKALQEVTVVGLTRRIIDLTRLLASETGYGGAWDNRAGIERHRGYSLLPAGTHDPSQRPQQPLRRALLQQHHSSQHHRNR